MKTPTKPELYRVLEVNPRASQQELKAARDRLARKLHPDKHARENAEQATKLFQPVQSAYETLSDARARSKYDQKHGDLLQAWDRYERRQEAHAERRRRRARLSTQPVEFRAGNETFQVHQSVLIGRSAYFRKRLECVAPDENNVRVFEFPHVNSDTIAVYVGFVISGDIETADCKKVEEAMESEELPEIVARHELEFLASLYIFGAEIQDDRFCDEVARIMARVIINGTDVLKILPSRITCETIYNATEKGSPARRILIDTFCDLAKPKHFAIPGLYPEEFVYDLMQEMTSKRDRGWTDTRIFIDLKRLPKAWLKCPTA